jgi:hypothetical protein
MNNIPEIPDFSDPKYSVLIDSLINGTCIFIGAGVSKLAGYKLWKELANEMITIFWNNRKNLIIHSQKEQKLNYSTYELLKSHEDSIEVMEYLSCLDNALFTKAIKEIFETTTENPAIFKAFSPLAQRTRNFFIQTNIDGGLQRHLNISPEKISINPYFGAPLAPKKLSYIHGYIDDAKSWIFTRGQYNRNYLDLNSPIMKFLEPIFRTNNVLFVGYSLRDFEILQAISRARLLVNQKDHKKHFLLEPFYGNKETLLQIKEVNYQNNYGITIIPYNIEKNDYNILLEVLGALNKVIIQKSSTIKEPQM